MILDVFLTLLTLSRYISQTQGLPAEHMLNSASKTVKFFYRDRDTTYPFWRLKTPEEHEQVKHRSHHCCAAMINIFIFVIRLIKDAVGGKASF
jgi:hypothetical protein